MANSQRRHKTIKRRRRRRRTSRGKLSDPKLRALVQVSRRLVKQRVRTSPQNFAKLRRLAACRTCREAHRVIQRGGLFPLIPLLMAAAPAIAKAALGAGVSLAAGAAGSAIKNAINKKR